MDTNARTPAPKSSEPQSSSIRRAAVHDDRTRDALVAAGVIAASAALWVLALGVLDSGPPAPTPNTYSLSPTARVERRPVLFAVRTQTAGADESDGSVGIAIPIASIEPGGALRPPLLSGVNDDARRALAAAFASNYLETGSALRLLYGGAAAGLLRFSGGADVTASPPYARVAYDPDSRADVLESAANDLLAISDSRYGSSSSGARPLRASHRSAVEQLARSALKERYPGAQVASVDVTRIRVADLDHSGSPELLASLTASLRVGSGNESIAVFLVGEPAAGATGTETYRLAYARTIEVSSPSEGFVFVDQADLTASAFDEVVVRSDEPGAFRYFVLERSSTGWAEVVASPTVILP